MPSIFQSKFWKKPSGPMEMDSPLARRHRGGLCPIGMAAAPSAWPLRGPRGKAQDTKVLCDSLAFICPDLRKRERGYLHTQDNYAAT